MKRKMVLLLVPLAMILLLVLPASGVSVSKEAESFINTDLPKGANQNPNRAQYRAELEKEKQAFTEEAQAKGETAAVQPQETPEELEEIRKMKEEAARAMEEDRKAVEEAHRITSFYSEKEYQCFNVDRETFLSFYSAAVEVYASGRPLETEMKALEYFIDDYYFHFRSNGDFENGREDLQKRTEEVLPTVTRYDP